MVSLMATPRYDYVRTCSADLLRGYTRLEADDVRRLSRDTANRLTPGASVVSDATADLVLALSHSRRTGQHPPLRFNHSFVQLLLRFRRKPAKSRALFLTSESQQLLRFGRKAIGR
jgi:hypothetical protein